MNDQVKALEVADSYISESTTTTIKKSGYNKH